MKFELLPYNRNTPDHELLNDVIRVAQELGKRKITIKEYNSNRQRKYNGMSIAKRFGGWNNVLKGAGLEIYQRKKGKFNKEQLIDDLNHVASKLNKKWITGKEYTKYGIHNYKTILKYFDSWDKALSSSGLQTIPIQTKKLFKRITDDELFENLKEIWIRLGKQPKDYQIAKPFSKYSIGTYERRFGGFRKALKSFIEYVSSETRKDAEESPDKTTEFISSKKTEEEKTIEIKSVTAHRHKTKREVNWRWKFLVMKRDNFKCRYCGRSPATHQNIVLNIDHIKSWENGGETILENLQTLCSICNIGKSNLE